MSQESPGTVTGGACPATRSRLHRSRGQRRLQAVWLQPPVLRGQRSRVHRNSRAACAPSQRALGPGRKHGTLREREAATLTRPAPHNPSRAAGERTGSTQACTESGRRGAARRWRPAQGLPAPTPWTRLPTAETAHAGRTKRHLADAGARVRDGTRCGSTWRSGADARLEHRAGHAAGARHSKSGRRRHPLASPSPRPLAGGAWQARVQAAARARRRRGLQAARESAWHGSHLSLLLHHRCAAAAARKQGQARVQGGAQELLCRPPASHTRGPTRSPPQRTRLASDQLQPPRRAAAGSQDGLVGPLECR